MNPSMQSCYRWTATMLLVVSGLALGSCGNQQEDTTPEIRPVRYAQAVTAGNQRTRTFPGVARAASEQDLAFRIPGTVTSVEVDVGSKVYRGQVLVRLDSGDLILRQQQAEAGLAQARAQSRNAKANYERIVALYESGNTSMSDMDAVRASFESANASEVSAETALRLAQQQVAYSRLTAPVNGSVSQVTVDVNETVGTGQTVIVLIDTDQNLEVQVTVPEGFIGGVNSGQIAEVVFGALGSMSFDALISEVGSAATGAGGFPVIARLNGDAVSGVRPGMAAEVTFGIEGLSDSTGVLVPPQAVQQDHSGRFVFILSQVDDFGVAVAERRTVTTGSLTPDGMKILTGVSPNDYVATAGLATLMEGQQVRLLDFNN